MNEYLSKVSVNDYTLFRNEVIKRTGWTRTQFNDRKIGRVKLSKLEREVIEQVIHEINTEQL